MTLVKPEETRVQINEEYDRVKITIPVKRNWLVFWFLGFWLIGWTLGEISAIGILVGKAVGWSFVAEHADPFRFQGENLFMIAWLAMWTVGGALAWSAWIYQFKGKEIIIRDNQYLHHKRDFVIFKRSKEYLNAHIKDIRLSQSIRNYYPMNSEQALEFWGMGGGLISFNYGAKTIRMGAGIDEAEVPPIVEVLKKYDVN